MIAVETNVLVYAHRADSPFHGAAVKQLHGLAEGGSAWSIPWPCVHEFLAIVTNQRIFKDPTPLPQALAQVEVWLGDPQCHAVGESEGYWLALRTLIQGSALSGGRVHDARIAAICLHHKIRELWTCDRDFSRFPKLKVRNPLV